MSAANAPANHSYPQVCTCAILTFVQNLFISYHVCISWLLPDFLKGRWSGWWWSYMQWVRLFKCIFLTRSRDISSCICGNQNCHFKSNHDVFPTITSCRLRMFAGQGHKKTQKAPVCRKSWYNYNLTRSLHHLFYPPEGHPSGHPYLSTIGASKSALSQCFSFSNMPPFTPPSPPGVRV